PALQPTKESQHNEAIKQVKPLREAMQDIQMSYRHSWQGFTLIEMLIALALMGILAAWGLPNFQALGERSAVASEVNRLQTALTLARNTAITQR
ncbi:pilus assembly FimT family protein, partial [Bacillus cereus group sp. Bce035]|uniref:pilus assembly FimT family protein n=1 Tax=Bacillus cereus group sp. Bce035 TaxID=3445234 RepID=UPI003F27A13D